MRQSSIPLRAAWFRRCGGKQRVASAGLAACVAIGAGVARQIDRAMLAFHAPVLSIDTTVLLAGAPRYATVAELVPEVTIGGLDVVSPEYIIDANSRVLVTREGRVWVASGGPQRSAPATVQIYSGAGTFVGYAGRDGDGPGEYRAPLGMAELADGRVVLRDALHVNRFTIFGRDGRADTVWTFPMTLRGGPQNRAPVVDPAGNVWVHLGPSAFSPADVAGYARISASGRIIDTVSDPTPSDAFPTGMNVVPPFWPRRVAALSPLGYFVTFDGSRYEVNLRVPRTVARPGAPATWRPGDRVLSIRRNVEPVRLSDAEYRDWRAYFEAAVRIARGARVGDASRVKPLIRGLYFGEDGRLWVQVSSPSERYDPPRRRSIPGEPDRPLPRWREPLLFDVFEQSGAYIGRARFPYDERRYATPVSLRGDTVWCRLKIEDDVEVLRRYRIAWR